MARAQAMPLDSDGAFRSAISACHRARRPAQGLHDDARHVARGLGSPGRATRSLLGFRDLLDRPGVAVGVAEVDEPSPGLDVDLAGNYSTAGQLLADRLDVVDDNLQALLRSGRHLGDPRSDHDRARGTWRRELHET